MTYFARVLLGIKPSIMITASHNPKEYNGFKICGTGSDTIYGEEIQNLRKFIENLTLKNHTLKSHEEFQYLNYL